MTTSKAFWVPLVGMSLILAALAFSPITHSPLRLGAIALGLVVLAIRAAFLFRKSRG